jgi:hypothetical protein
MDIDRTAANLDGFAPADGRHVHAEIIPPASTTSLGNPIRTPGTVLTIEWANQHEATAFAGGRIGY